MTIALAAIAGVIASLAVCRAFVDPDGPAWAAGLAVVIILVIGGLRGFEAAIAAAIAASATVTGLWIWRATGDGDIWDSLVPVLFVGVGTLLALIILGGIAAAIGQGVRAARNRRATDDGRRPS